MVEIEFDGVGKAFGGNVVFQDFSAQLQPGKITAVRGDNGSGKTTALNVMAERLGLARDALCSRSSFTYNLFLCFYCHQSLEL